jgi:hypothetical protein
MIANFLIVRNEHQKSPQFMGCDDLLLHELDLEQLSTIHDQITP